jgi:Lon protease-like protein
MWLPLSLCLSLVLLVADLLVVPKALAFQFQSASQSWSSRHGVTSLRVKESSSDGLDEADRMELVRKLQKSFYQDPTNESPRAALDPSTGILQHLPLWRVGWVEVPGRANCLNVHEGHYTNMFETILSGPEPWYFGHLHLPGGTKNARSQQAQFELKNWREELRDESRWEQSQTERSAVVGCLMKITDYRRLQDGRLLLFVHPLERFVVEKTIQSFPFALADVQILPDIDYLPIESSGEGDENFYKVARAKAVKESFAFHDYEFSKTKLLALPKEKDYLETTASFGSAVAQLLPFAFYSDDDSSLVDMDTIDSSKTSAIASESFLGGNPPLEKTLIQSGILQYPLSLTAVSDATKSCTVLETLLWLELDDFCRTQAFQLPAEILILMPPTLADTLDMDSPEQRLSPKYPASRRQQRLSYHVPALIEQTQYGANMRQTWLNTPSTAARLRAVLERFQAINENLMGQFE